MQDKKSQIEAILFASGEPVKIDKLAKFLQLKLEECRIFINEMKQNYLESGSGLDLVFKNDQVQMVSAKQHGQTISVFLDRQLNEELSRAAAEVLAVIAYRGPLTRAQIEQIRGVNCSFTLRNLAMRGLIDRADNPADSRSYIYEISFNFLKSMGLSRVEELPDYESLHNAFVIEEKPIEQNEPSQSATISKEQSDNQAG